MQRPFPDHLLQALAHEFGTPLYVQGLDELPRRVADLGAFDVVRYAMKANSGPEFLDAIRRAGAWVDCVSAGELTRALAAGFEPHQTCFTADLFDRRSLPLVAELGCPVNLGSEDMIEQYAGELARRGVALDGTRGVTLRLNPGFGHGHSTKVNTGGPASKHGIWHTHLDAAVGRVRAAGLEVTGLHMHIGSGTDMQHLLSVCAALASAARRVGPSLRTISAGGGLPVPYREGDPELDLGAYSQAWTDTRDQLAAEFGHALDLEVEPGRYLAAKPAVLLSEVRAVKDVDGMPFVLVDAGFNALCRPMVYGAYHGISIVGRDGAPTRPTMVAGPLCESGDVFTQALGGEPAPRDLPACRVGDLLCLHDTGAYGLSMASTFNSMPIPAEVVVEGNEARLVGE
ncbi:Diaminopimelate decarboxylase [Planctomycetes bacterium Pla163]|uniref:Diaminopimelate decarboxylase n=1 Tax=Rohdeia mirabilis TaxID=2528008 RepID=A0A518D0U5_9BACT|nr:Diaminopimelate decarboxylase [Planctomycetes bacterium Pla163]